jgi:hypothetical protein
MKILSVFLILGLSLSLQPVLGQNKIIVLSHLAQNETQDSCINLSNQYDYSKPMKVYRFSENENELYCKTLHVFDEIIENTEQSDAFLLIVHGAGKTLQESVQIAMDIKTLYSVNVLIYNWPAMVGRDYDTKNLKGIKAKVEEGSEQFIDLLRLAEQLKSALRDSGRGSKWSLFLHSIGNYYLEDALKNDKVVTFDNVLFENVILNAAAVDAKAHAIWLEKLHMQHRIFVNSNKKDMILRGLKHLTHAKTQLGSKAKGVLASNAVYINFSNAVAFQKPVYKTHSYYAKEIPLQSINIRNYYNQLFSGEEPDFSDRSHFIPSKRKREYYIKF